jgi:hypothetical protein
LAIVLLTVNSFAGPVLLAVQLAALGSGHLAIGLGGYLIGLDASFTLLKMRRFTRGQLARCHALAYTRFLIGFTLVNAWGRSALCEGSGAKAQRESNQHGLGCGFQGISLHQHVKFAMSFQRLLTTKGLRLEDKKM